MNKEELLNSINNFKSKTANAEHKAEIIRRKLINSWVSDCSEEVNKCCEQLDYVLDKLTEGLTVLDYIVDKHIDYVKNKGF